MLSEKSLLNRVMLSGGSGYLGNKLAKRIIDLGFQPIFLVHDHKLNDCFAQYPQIKLNIDGTVDGDVAALSNIAFSINCAVNYGRQGETETQIVDANFSFPVRFWELSNKLNVPYFINCMTSIPKYINSYTLSKHLFSEWAEFHANSSEYKFINCILEHFFGPGENPKNKFIAFLLETFKNNAPCRLTKGEQLRDFIYIDDVLDAFEIIFNNLSGLDKPFTKISIGSGNPLRIREIAKIVKQLTKSSSEIKLGALPYRKNEIMFSSANPIWLKQRGWKVNFDFSQGIQKILNEGDI